MLERPHCLALLISKPMYTVDTVAGAAALCPQMWVNNEVGLRVGAKKSLRFANDELVAIVPLLLH